MKPLKVQIQLLLWNGGQEKIFNDNEQAFTRAPVHSLPTLKKPFILYIAEKQGTDRLKSPHTEVRGSSSPIGDFSKQLDSMA